MTRILVAAAAASLLFAGTAAAGPRDECLDHTPFRLAPFCRFLPE